MKKIIKLSLLFIIAMNSAALAVEKELREKEHSVKELMSNITESEEKKVSIVDNFKHMFSDATVSGNIRSIYSSFDNKNAVDTYATALGGWLKYELSQYNGLNAAVSFSTTNNINFVTGNNQKLNIDLSSSKGHYTSMNEAYINYEHKGLNVRVGRQIIDTPLADSDDIRMVPDTFEAYVASYELNEFSLMLGHLNAWQGYDAGLDNAWVKIGKNGANFAGVSYSDDIVDASAWYYNISNGDDANGNNSFYTDLVGHFEIKDNIFLHTGIQYLNQRELDNSGVQADIYGAMTEIVIHGLSLGISYDKSTKHTGKHSFSGYGGGTLFTSMDTMILDEITQDRDAQAVVGGLTYDIASFDFLYAYGDFKGDADSRGVKEHIIAQNIGVEYSPNDNFTIGTVYVIHENKEASSTLSFDDKNFRILFSYNF